MNIYFGVNVIIICLAIIFNLIQANKSQINRLQINTHKDGTNNAVFCGFIFIILVFITGFRGAFSPDYGNYVYLFQTSGMTSFKDIILGNIGVERGYALLNKIVYMFDSNPIAIMVIVAVIIMYCYLRVFRRYSDIVWLSVILLLTVGSYSTVFNTMRQFLAGALMFLAAKFIYEGNWKKYFISVLLVMTIHTSAIVMLLFYFLLRIRWNTKKNLSIGISLFIIYIFVYIKVDYIVEFFAAHFYKGYTSPDAFGIANGTSFLNVVRPFLLLIFSLYGLTKIKLDKITHVVWLNASIYFFLFSLLSTEVEMLQRFTYFFIPFMTLLIPRIINSIENDTERKIMIVLVTILVCSYAFATQRNEPFYFIWN